MSFPSQPSGSDQVRSRPQAVFSQTSYNEIAKRASEAGLLQPNGSGLTPLAIGESIPLVFCKRTADPTGGVFLSPKAAKLKFVEGSTAATDPNFSSVVLLLPFDGNYSDASPNGVTVTVVGSPSFSSSVAKFGESWLTTDGGSNYLTIPGSSLNIGTTFTVEGWVRTTQSASQQYVFERRDSGNAAFFELQLNSSSNIVTVRSGGTGRSYSITVSTNTWYHFAIVGDGSNTYLYWDGTQQSPAIAASNAGSTSDGQLTIGRSFFSATAEFRGYIDDLRITAGVARYSTSFTPPTSAYPTTGTANLPDITRNYWLVCSSGQLDNPSLTFFYGDKILGSGTLYYNTACPFTPVRTITNETYDDALPKNVGDANGTFAGLSGIDYTYTDGTATFYQAHVFTNFGVEVERLSSSGTGASNLFSDLMNYLLQETALVPADLIDTTGLGTVGLFLENNNLFFDGAIQASTNLREFLENGSFYFLTYVTQNEGKWGLTPRLPVNGSNQFDTGVITPSKIFTATDIIADTFERSNRDVSETLPFTAVMSYRNEPGNAPSEVKTVEVRYTGEATGGPFERYDMTEFCTRSDHAEIIGKYIIAMRRWSTHSVRFSSTQESSDLNIGDIFRVDFDVESTLGGTDQYDETYQVISIEESQQGLVVIEGQHFPLMPDGSSRIVDQLTNNFVRPVQPLIKQFTVAVDDSSPTNGQTVTFTPTIDSDLTDLSYQWTTPTGSTPGQSVTTEILSFTYNSSTDEGKYTLTVSSPSALDSPQSASDFIGTEIGNVQVVPSTRDYANGNTITFTASFDGNATDVVWSWTGPAGTNAPVATETSNVLTWTAGGSEDEGTYTVTATSVTSFDSPQQAQAVLNYRPFYQMSGGTVTTDGNFKIHTFTNNGTLSISYAPAGTTFDYLICASGGPGNYHGGGGGGGVLTGSTTSGVQNWSIAVGQSITYPNQFGVGNSSAFGFTANRGGDGYDYDGLYQGQNGPNGGCGGGTVNYSAGVGSQGFNGASGQKGGSAYNDGIGNNSTQTYAAGGGGGGMTAAGTSGTSNDSTNTGVGGDGGEGLTSSITGTSVVYGSGGGGGCYMYGSATGGTGGTGAGDGGYFNGTTVVNTNKDATGYGCGGGGSASYTSYGAGGQGIVIVRYQYQ